MKRWLAGLGLFFLLAFLFSVRSSLAADLAVVADAEFEDTVTALRKSLDFVLLKGEELRKDLCDYPRLLILGPESYLRIKDRPCPGQKRYLGGVLYPGLLGVSPEVRLISPLPSCRLLRHYGRAWVVLRSRYLTYYLDYIRSCFPLRELRVKTPYELAQVLPSLRRYLAEGFRLLVLPDPILVSEKGQAFLREFLAREHPRGVDLLGISEGGLPSPPFSPEVYAHTAIQALAEDRSLFYRGAP